MKILRYATLVALALGLFAAAGGVATAVTETNTFPEGASYIDGQAHAIGAEGALWYRFGYAGDNSAVTIKLLNGDNSGMGFKVYTPSQVAAWWDADPIGQGTTNGDDLLWVGNFNGAGTYYVRVDNGKPYQDQFRLTIAGEGVTIGAPTIVSKAGAASVVAAPALTPNLDPYHAAAIDGGAHTIAAKSSLWYHFDYDAGDRPVVFITLLNGTESGVGFNVFTAEQAATWWDTDPVGRGTADTEPCEGLRCLSNDLTWAGSFNLSGTYYVEVVNKNVSPMSFTLTVQ